MELTDFIAAVDLGTSKILGIVAARKNDGSLRVYAIEEEESDSCIKRGCIQNVDETAAKLSRLIHKLESSAKCRIGKIYVGLGGQSLQSVDNKVTRVLNEEAPITDRIINSLNEESRSLPISNKEILDIIPLEYLVDQKRVSQPVGVYATEIEANHKIIAGRPSIRKNIRRVLEKVGVEEAGLILSPLAAACVLPENEKSLGCALVDFGAGTTTLSIYKDGLLRHLSVIPLGGHAITKDITSLKLLEKDAEKVKIEHGSADPATGNEPNRMLRREGSPEIQVSLLNQCITSRQEEILENVANQIKQAGFDRNKLSAGFVVTGGASAMTGLPELILKLTDMDSKPGRVQKAVDYSRYAGFGERGAYSVLIGLALKGNVNCAKPKDPEPEPIVEPVVEEQTVGATAAEQSATHYGQPASTEPQAAGVDESVHDYGTQQQQASSTTEGGNSTDKKSHGPGAGIGGFLKILFGDDKDTKRD